MSYIDEYKKYLEEFDKRWDEQVAKLKADIEEAFRKIYEQNQQNEEKPKSYTAGQVMKILHISRNTLCKYHKLGYIKREANNRYNASDVETLRTTHKGTYVRKVYTHTIPNETK